MISALKVQIYPLSLLKRSGLLRVCEYNHELVADNTF